MTFTQQAANLGAGRYRRPPMAAIFDNTTKREQPPRSWSRRSVRAAPAPARCALRFRVKPLRVAGTVSEYRSGTSRRHRDFGRNRSGIGHGRIKCRWRHQGSLIEQRRAYAPVHVRATVRRWPYRSGANGSGRGCAQKADGYKQRELKVRHRLSSQCTLVVLSL
jgi:hypothetical protein